MRIDETDTSELAQRLRVGPQELLRAIGGPWWIVERAPESEAARPGALFAGRAGPSVGLLVAADATTVLVGVASGRWEGSASLVWTVTDPVAEVAAPPRSAPSGEVDAFIEALRLVVDEAAAARSPHLVTCRYCGILVAPEHAFGDDCCQGCASTLFGAVY